MTTVKQPTARPTNKLMVAAAVGPAAAEVWAAVMVNAYPALAGPAMQALVGAFAALVGGYLIKDRPNVVMARQ